MALSNIFSKRKAAAAKKGDVYSYDKIPDTLRVQIVQIWKDIAGQLVHLQDEYVFAGAKGILCREYGWFKLFDGYMENGFEEVVRFFLRSATTDQALDVIEQVFSRIEEVHDINASVLYGAVPHLDGIRELNARLREHGVGYQYENRRVIRIDSTLIHDEVMRPALALLGDPAFKGANDEFMSAHGYFRTGDYGACLNDCLKAFESTLKIIIKGRKWKHAPNDTAKRLLEVVFEQGLVPTFIQSHFSSLRSILESGVPTVRNRLGGHGKGDEERDVLVHVAAYALHLTATNIVFLIESYRSSSKS